MSFLSKIFKSGFGEVGVGIDFGTTSVKVVEIKQDLSGVLRLANYGALENYGSLERINDAIQTSSMRIMEREASNLLKMLLEKMRLSTKKVVMTLPAFSAFITSMEFPKMSDEDLVRAIPFQAKSFIPIPLNETIFEWVAIRPSAEEITFRNLDKTQVLLLAISKDVVERYKRIAQMAKLELLSLELELLSCLRSIALPADAVLILDIGACNTTIAVVDNLCLRQIKVFELAGNDLTLAIAKGLGIDPLRAESLKKIKGLLVSPGEEEYAGLMYPIIDNILEESRKIMDSYGNLTSRHFKKLFLGGGAVRLIGLKDYTASQFPSLDVQVIDSFAKIAYSDNIGIVLDKIRSSFMNACGAALQRLI